MARTKPLSTEPIVVPPHPAYVFDHTYVFRLRRIKGGTFHGLWELCKMGESGQVEKVISDADALNFCIENLQGELETDGF